MATISLELSLGEAEYPTSAAAQFVRVAATVPFDALSFSDAADDTAYWSFCPLYYASGNPTLRIHWQAATGASGDVVFDCAIACVTPNTDTQDFETKTLATAQSVTDSHLGTTNKRLHETTITISNLDSLAAGDEVRLRFRRVGSSGSDTMTGNAYVTRLIFSYSDT